MSLNSGQAIDTALEFARALAQRDYVLAYTLTTREYQGKTSLSRVQEEFERVVPYDWGDIELHSPDKDDAQEEGVLEDWPDKQPSDVAWVYVGLAGDVYRWTEGLYILISREGPSLKVRDVEFGRP